MPLDVAPRDATGHRYRIRHLPSGPPARELRERVHSRPLLTRLPAPLSSHSPSFADSGATGIIPGSAMSGDPPTFPPTSVRAARRSLLEKPPCPDPSRSSCSLRFFRPPPHSPNPLGLRSRNHSRPPSIMVPEPCGTSSRRLGIYGPDTDWPTLIDEAWGPSPWTVRYARRVRPLLDQGRPRFACFQGIDVDWSGLRDRYRPEIEGGVSHGGSRRS